MDIGTKNTLAFREAIKELQEQSADLQVALNHANEMIGSLMGRLNELEQTIRVMKAISTSRGPSVRE